MVKGRNATVKERAKTRVRKGAIKSVTYGSRSLKNRQKVVRMSHYGKDKR
jgi:hypothetical protein